MGAQVPAQKKPALCVEYLLLWTLWQALASLDLMTSLKAFSGRMTASDQTLARAIKRLRVERGITQESLAFQAEVTIATLSRIERGVTNPAWPTLRKIANALAITPVELIAAAEDARPRAPENN